MNEHEIEPIAGLPGIPPAGERILWQGRPQWHALARTAFHTRLIAGYFALLTATAAIIGAASGDGYVGVAMTASAGVVGVALLHLLAWATARTAVYTLTNRRVVLRVGIALPKCINLPLSVVGAVDLTLNDDGTGDVPLRITAKQQLGYAALWPHARAWRLAEPQPMLRSIADAATVGALIARTCLAAQPDGRLTLVDAPAATAPSLQGAVAA